MVFPILFLLKRLSKLNEKCLYNFDFNVYRWRPTSGGVVTHKTGRREVPGSNPGRACRSSRSEFSVAFSETRVNTDKDPLGRPPTDGTLAIVLGP